MPSMHMELRGHSASPISSISVQIHDLREVASTVFSITTERGQPDTLHTRTKGLSTWPLRAKMASWDQSSLSSSPMHKKLAKAAKRLGTS